MASTKLLTFFFPASLLLLSISPFGSSENVTVSVYYETLCPYCADFIVNHLVKLFQKGLNSIVNLRMIPWGNSMMQPDGTFVCQHGPGECLLNTIEACTISIYPDVVQHFSFIHCVERLALEKRQAEWINCFELTKLGRVPIDCYRNGLGKLDFMNFANHVCKAYKGTRVPEACRSLPNNIPVNAESTSSVCYTEGLSSLIGDFRRDDASIPCYIIAFLSSIPCYIPSLSIISSTFERANPVARMELFPLHKQVILSASNVLGT
ncbi:hypothetical protein CUMW_000580 [Citrus unshiu]|nr:hypothetical protein CUMW_000580 [Citrus unshiu]